LAAWLQVTDEQLQPQAIALVFTPPQRQRRLHWLHQANQVLDAADAQKGQETREKGRKSQIPDTKNPGLSTRVFAIDSK
jgi:hypothetical protein